MCVRVSVCAKCQMLAWPALWGSNAEAAALLTIVCVYVCTAAAEGGGVTQEEEDEADQRFLQGLDDTEASAARLLASQVHVCV